MRLEHQYSVERLENRRLLAGNVRVWVTDAGDLRVVGDRTANEIVISDHDSAGSYVVTGGRGTTVNGEQRLVVDGVERRVWVNLRAGDDRVALDGVRLTDSLRVATGRGDDQVLVYQSTVEHVQIRTSGGDDGVFHDQLEAGHVRVRTSGGDDRLLAFSGSVDTAEYRTGGGRDQFYLSAMTVGSEASAELGGGDDKAYVIQFTDELAVSGGAGADNANQGAPILEESVELATVELDYWTVDFSVANGTVDLTLELL